MTGDSTLNREDLSTVAIVLPVYNEKERIAAALDHLKSLGADEVIVVDGCSTDGTFEDIEQNSMGVKVFRTAFPERALQMNVGAFEAESDILVFSHVDMKFPATALADIKRTIRRGAVGGGFPKRYEPAGWILNSYAFLLNTIYLGVFHSLVGTNGIFLRRDIFETMHGFPETGFLEDVVFSRNLKSMGRIAVAGKNAVVISSRRYKRQGILRQILRNIRVMFGYHFLGESPAKLNRLYHSGIKAEAKID